MVPTILSDIPLVATIWKEVELPDKCRDSIRVQAKSLGILNYSFDAGSSYMTTVGAGDTLYGNFSKQTIWFQTPTDDYVKIMVLDKLY